MSTYKTALKLTKVKLVYNSQSGSYSKDETISDFLLGRWFTYHNTEY